MATSAQKIESRAKLYSSVLEALAPEQAQTFKMPGMYDDAESELRDERVLIAAREFVEAHDGIEVAGG